MKGTLFSADFVLDSNDNLRLLEFNTDTAFTSGALAQSNFDDFVEILSSSNINDVEVIYKGFHKNAVTAFSQSIVASPNFNPSWTEHKEAVNEIYPTSVTDASDKFIFRLAYDENAIFDSTYCKTNDDTFKLFASASQADKVAGFYASGSDGLFNTFVTSSFNTNAPDVVRKKLQPVGGEPIELLKIGGTGTTEQKYQTYFNNTPSNTISIQYYNDSAATRHSSIRSFGILYGSDLSQYNIATVEVPALLEKPSSIAWDSSAVSSSVDLKHFLEFASNYPKPATHNSNGGIFEDEEIIDYTGSAQRVDSLNVNDYFKSYFISGSPDTDNPDIFGAWYHSGNEIPSGSYVTSSRLVAVTETDLAYKTVNNIVTSNSASFRISEQQHVLIYDVDQDLIRYEVVKNITPSNAKLFDVSGSLVDIASNTVEILNETGSVYVIDMEENDTFILNSGQLNLKIVTHNLRLGYTCFPAGTEIHLADGETKNIEDVRIGDEVLTVNEETGQKEPNKVYEVLSPIHDDLIKYSLSDGSEIISTFDHPYYINGFDLGSFKPHKTNKLYQMPKEVVKIKEGDSFTKLDGSTPTVVSTEVQPAVDTQTYVIRVENNHNFFANNILVHNK